MMVMFQVGFHCLLCQEFLELLRRGKAAGALKEASPVASQPSPTSPTSPSNKVDQAASFKLAELLAEFFVKFFKKLTFGFRKILLLTIDLGKN